MDVEEVGANSWGAEEQLSPHPINAKYNTQSHINALGNN